MRSPLLLTATLLAAVAVPTAQAATPLTFVVTSVTTVTLTHDTPPKGKANAGDSIDFKDLLYTTTTNELGKKKKNKPVAYDAGTVLYTSATTQKIEGVTTVPGVGTLTFAGAMVTQKDGTVHVPVTKGTGSFKGAKGMLIIGTGDDKAPNTYRLTLLHPLCAGSCA